MINRNQELYKKTEYVSSNVLIIETNLYSNMLDMMKKIVEYMFEDPTIEQNVKNLIDSSFYTLTGIKNDMATLQAFAHNLNVLLNG
jgi:hypothetical protein